MAALLVHGGGMTGACWETTPDGRPGWLQAFLRAGLPVDVLDNVERGRAGWSCLPNTWNSQPILRGEREAWTAFRLGAPDDYNSRTPFPDSRFPIDAIDGLLCLSVPRWPSNGDLASQRLQDVVDELGPCVLIGHSQGGGLCAHAAATRSPAVRAVVLVEPHGLPESGVAGTTHPPQLTIIGDHVASSTMWTQLVEEMHRHTAQTRQTGAVADILDLPAQGIHGNTHNPMMDTNSDEIADLVLDWLATQRTAGRLE
jgi:pimeloyl-ACP methyl ester carboxylesterase